MSTPIQDQSQQETLRLLREAVLFERQEKMDAPAAAKQEVERRIGAATDRKLALIKAAYDGGATKVAIAAQLGIQNLGQVSKLIARAEGIEE